MNRIMYLLSFFCTFSMRFFKCTVYCFGHVIMFLKFCNKGHVRISNWCDVCVVQLKSFTLKYHCLFLELVDR